MKRTFKTSYSNIKKRINKRFDNKFSILNGAKYISSGISVIYSVFIQAEKYIKYFSGTTRIESRKSNEMAEQSIENITKSNTNFSPTVIDHKF